MSAVLCIEQAARPAQAPAGGPLRVTLFTSARGLLTKRLSLAADGTLQKDPAANMHEGTAETLALADLRELDELLQRATPAQAIGQGIASEARVRIVNERRERASGGAIARTQRHFQFPAGPGVMLLDHDGMPGESLDADELRQRIVAAVPELAEAPMLIRQSVSAGVRGPDGVLLTPYGKWHAYIAVSDARRIPDAGEALELRLWAAGIGWYDVGKAGQALPRTLVDAFTHQPERLDFCAAPVLGEGLTQEWLPSKFYGDPAATFDLSRITTVDGATAARAADNRLAARAAVAQRCHEQREAWAATRASIERPKAAAAPAKAKKPRRTSTEAPAALQGNPWVAELLPRLPHAPYSADDFKRDMRIRELAKALGKANLQVNLPTARLWLTFDVDHEDAANAWKRAGLPEPTWTAINPENGHAHLVWGLAVPVLRGCEAASVKALRYLAAIEACFAARLGADPGYRGVTTKNPTHPRWKVSHGDRLQLYTLHELGDGLPELPTYRPPRKAQQQAGEGRAVYLFNGLLRWAVRAIREHWGADDLASWVDLCRAHATTINAQFPAPLEWREVRHAAKCVAGWTRKNITPEGFSAWQATRGKKGGAASGAARRLANEDKRASARRMALEGSSSREIAAELGVDQSTVVRWLKG